jgi:hypothetical protein
LVGSSAHAPAFEALGELQIGHGRYSGTYVENFVGAIDDVSVYSRPLLTDQIVTMAGRDLSLVHH